MQDQIPVRSPIRRRTIATIFGLCIVALSALAALIGRLPVKGHIAVTQSQSDRFSQIMKENGVLFWTGHGGMGMMGVQFDNPFALAAVDDLILDDARKNKYTAIIRYECIIPYFDHEVIVNWDVTVEWQKQAMNAERSTARLHMEDQPRPPGYRKRSANGAFLQLVSTILGDPTDFAIEVLTEPHLVSPSAIWGRMCIHIGDLTLGNFADEHCALYSSYRHFESLIWDTTPLWDTSFNGLTLEQIHDTVRTAIYGDSSTTANARRYARYDFLTNWGEQFDWYSSVIVQQSWDTVTILFRPSPDAPEHRRMTGDFLIATCTHDGFLDAGRRFVDWFDAETKRLTPEAAEQ